MAAANNFTANQSITGNLTSTAQVANLNASLLQGLAPSAFAGTGANVFTGNQTIPGQGGVNAVIGNVGCSSAAGISFLASNNCNNYAIAGTTTETVINRPSGGSIVFAEGNGSPQFAVVAGGNTEVLGGVFTSTPTATTGSTIAVTGSNPSTSGTGVAGVASATSGATTGVLGQSSSASGIAGVFNNTAGGQILSGKNNGSQIFSVSGAGLVSASGGLTLPVSGTGVTFPDGTKQTTAGKSGTVTSVGLSAPASDFVVTGSPVTSSGTFNLAWNVAPTSSNTANAIVKRDANGGFSVGYVNAQSGSQSPVLSAVSYALGGLGVYGGHGSLSVTGSSFQTYNIGVFGDTNASFSADGVVGTADDANAGYFVVPVDGGARTVAMSAIESPQNWFEDFGEAELVDGAAVVQLDSTYIQTVNAEIKYQVFLTPYGDCQGLYATNRTANSFEVHELGGGRAKLTFGYRIAALRRKYENVRFDDQTRQTQRLARDQEQWSAQRSGAAAAPAKLGEN